MKNFHTYKKSLLTVVGAGPGDIDLITLKAIKVLKTADVVLLKTGLTATLCFCCIIALLPRL